MLLLNRFFVVLFSICLFAAICHPGLSWGMEKSSSKAVVKRKPTVRMGNYMWVKASRTMLHPIDGRLERQVIHDQWKSDQSIGFEVLPKELVKYIASFMAKSRAHFFLVLD